MPIEIKVEDGSQVAGANSFVSIAEAREYAANRGVEMPVGDDEIAAMLIRAADYIETLGCKFQGQKTASDQLLQWPRAGVYLHGLEFSSNQIPNEVRLAQKALVIAINSGVDILPNYTNGAFVIEETVGPITTKYADPTAIGVLPTLTQVEAILAPLFGSNACGFKLRTYRV